MPGTILGTVGCTKMNDSPCFDKLIDQLSCVFLKICLFISDQSNLSNFREKKSLLFLYYLCFCLLHLLACSCEGQGCSRDAGLRQLEPGTTL